MRIPGEKREMSYEIDFADVRGQETAKRAAVIAAAGGHNLLMVGPPGSGKNDDRQAGPLDSSAALTASESIETTSIYSTLGKIDPAQPLLTARPFREPHHTISHAGLAGGGSPPAPGEISLAHHGVLFLDELPEFKSSYARSFASTARRWHRDDQSGGCHIDLSRRIFMLIAALNPCPCGYRTDPRRDCHCTAPQIERYMGKISGPLLDRIDLHHRSSGRFISGICSGERSGTSSTHRCARR